MGEGLRERGLVHEETAGAEDARDLAERGLPRMHVVAGAEVEHRVERAVGERKVADVCGEEATRDAVLPQIALRTAKQSGIHVDSGDLRRLQQTGEGPEADPPTAADLEDLPPGRKAEEAHEGRNLQRPLGGVPPLEVGKGTVRGYGRRIGRHAGV